MTTNSLGDSEVVPGWGAVVVAVPPGVVISNANSLLEVANAVMSEEDGDGIEKKEVTLHSSGGIVNVVSPQISLDHVAASPWYERIYGSTAPTPATESMPSQARKEVGVIRSLQSLLQCPQMRASSGEEKTLQVTQSRWMS